LKISIEFHFETDSQPFSGIAIFGGRSLILGLFVDDKKTKMHNFSAFQSSTHCKMQIGIEKDEFHHQSVFKNLWGTRCRHGSPMRNRNRNKKEKLHHCFCILQLRLDRTSSSSAQSRMTYTEKNWGKIQYPPSY
jgi:hypothetical protein